MWRPSRGSGSIVLGGFLPDLDVGRVPCSMLKGQLSGSGLGEKWACRNFVIRTREKAKIMVQQALVEKEINASSEHTSTLYTVSNRGTMLSSKTSLVDDEIQLKSSKVMK